MKREVIFSGLLLIAVSLIFGCINLGGGGEKKGGAMSELYNVTFTPSKVVEGGVVNIKATLFNPWDNDMRNVKAKIYGFDTSRFSVSEEEASIGTILPGQKYTQIWTISVNSLATNVQTFSPKIQVCFDEKTTFYFDTILLPKTGSEEMPERTQGYSNGPLSMTLSGLDVVYTTGNEVAGSIEFSNAVEGGHIEEIYNITLNAPDVDDVNNMTLKYLSHEVSCEAGETCTITKDTAKNFNNTNIVGSGATFIVKLDAKEVTDGQPHIIQPSGEIFYKYCYDINVGEITACKAGKC